MKSREHIVTNGRAVFYASMWGDFRKAALDCGWALALHGSLSSDMDIMAMPWVEGAKSVEEMIESLESCMTKPDERIFKTEKCDNKPNNRIVYTIHIFADFYLDINIINPVSSGTDRNKSEPDEGATIVAMGDKFEWTSEHAHYDNSYTMSEYLDNHLPDGANLFSRDGSYAEVMLGSQMYALDAKGNGDCFSHVVYATPIQTTNI